MAKYEIEVKSSARKELEKLSDPIIGRVMAKLEGLAADPMPSGCKKLPGYKGAGILVAADCINRCSIEGIRTLLGF